MTNEEREQKYGYALKELARVAGQCAGDTETMEWITLCVQTVLNRAWQHTGNLVKIEVPDDLMPPHANN